MRIWKHLAGIVFVALVVVAVVLFWRRPSGFERFMHQPATYYVELAHACEALRQARPVGTNSPVSLSGRDPTLPAVLRELHCDEILLHPNRLWIAMGSDRNSFAILWEPDESQPGSWVLMTDYDGFLRKVYVETRP